MNALMSIYHFSRSNRFSPKKKYQAILSIKVTDAYLRPCKTSMMEVLTVNYFRKKASSQMFESILNKPLSQSSISK